MKKQEMSIPGENNGMCFSGDVRDYVLMYFYLYFLVVVFPCYLCLENRFITPPHTKRKQVYWLYIILHVVTPIKAQCKRYTVFLKLLIFTMDPQAPWWKFIFYTPSLVLWTELIYSRDQTGVLYVPSSLQTELFHLSAVKYFTSSLKVMTTEDPVSILQS